MKTDIFARSLSFSCFPAGGEGSISGVKWCFGDRGIYGISSGGNCLLSEKGDKVDWVMGGKEMEIYITTFLFMQIREMKLVNFDKIFHCKGEDALEGCGHKKNLEND